MNRRLALCVGINYQGTEAELGGCINDAKDWTRLLVGQGYAVSTLTETAATKATVVSNLNWLVDAAGFGDRIVFTYSGHGSWVPDRNGDEADRRDECLVLYDYKRGGILLDDEIDAVFARRRWGVRVLILSDSCHSGTVSRAFNQHAPGTARFLPPASFLQGDDLMRAARVDPTVPIDRPRPTTALMSGCSDLEYSYDAWLGDRARGVFTTVAQQTYAPKQSLAVWHRKIREHLPSEMFPQSPQLVATASQRRWSL